MMLTKSFTRSSSVSLGKTTSSLRPCKTKSCSIYVKAKRVPRTRYSRTMTPMVREVEQPQELGAAAIKARANFLHHAHEMLAVRGDEIFQLFHFPSQIVFLIHP